MICTRIFVMMMLLGLAASRSSALPQESDSKSASSQQSPNPSQATPSQPNSDQTPSSAAPDQSTQKGQAEKPKDSQPSQSEGMPAEQTQPATQGSEAEQPNNVTAQPEEKTAVPCAAQGSAQGKCEKQSVRQSHRTVIHRGSTGEPKAQLVPDMTPEQAARHRHTTEQYLNSANDDLRKLGARNLDQNQQETVSQIRNYMADAHAALGDGDLSRARTLAFKARLLADDLVKH